MMDIENENPQRKAKRPRESLDRSTTPPRKSNCRSKLSLSEKSYAYTQWRDGENINNISATLNRSWNTIGKFLRKVEENEAFDDQNSSKGRWKKGLSKLNQRQKDLIYRWLSDNDTYSTRDVWRRLTNLKNLPRVPYDTVRRHIVTLGSWIKPNLRTVLSGTNIIKRQEFCETHSEDMFEDTLFTDESTFELNTNYTKVFRFKGPPMPTRTKYNPNHSWMAWAGISYHGKTRVYFITGWINNQIYKEQLMKARRDILRLMPHDWQFMHDNAKPHKRPNPTNCIKRYLTDDILMHPPQSPDFNPIELVWAKMKREVHLRRSKNKAELKAAIEECWNNISLEFVRNCIDSVRNKIHHFNDN